MASPNVTPVVTVPVVAKSSTNFTVVKIKLLSDDITSFLSLDMSKEVLTVITRKGIPITVISNTQQRVFFKCRNCTMEIDDEFDLIPSKFIVKDIVGTDGVAYPTLFLL
jgi:hypothetical protein